MSERPRCRRTKIIDTQTLACFTRHRRRNRKAQLYAPHHIYVCVCVCVCAVGGGMCCCGKPATEVDNLGARSSFWYRANTYRLLFFFLS